jgi:hypothetical protein
MKTHGFFCCIWLQAQLINPFNPRKKANFSLLYDLLINGQYQKRISKSQKIVHTNYGRRAAFWQQTAYRHGKIAA